MHCENCGAETTPGARFCGSCGAPQGGGRPPGRTLRERLSSLAGTTRWERLLAAGTAIAVAIAIGSFVLLDTDEDDPRSVAFIGAADAGCVVAKREIEALGETLPAREGRAAQRTLTRGLLETVSGWWADFEGLEPPPEQGEAADEYGTALRTLMIDLGTLSRVSREGSQAEIAAAAGRADDATEAVETEIAELELTACERLSIGSPTSAG